MPETTPLIKAALNLRVGAGFDVYVKATKKVTVFRCSDHSNFLSLYKGKQMLIDKIFFS